MTARISADSYQLILDAWPDIIDRVADGEALESICSEYPFSRSMVYAFRRMSSQVVRDEFDEAFKDGAYAAADDIRTTISNTALDPKFARVRLQGLQWLAERRDADRFGQRVKADFNVRHIDLAQVIGNANQRLAQLNQGRIIDSTAHEIVDAHVLALGAE